VAETAGLKQYQVEAQKLGRTSKINLWVSMIRGPKGKTRLLGEAYTKHLDNPMVYFRVVNAEKEDEVYDEFLRLLVYRGYLPLQFRTLVNDTYGSWEPCDLKNIDTSRVLETENKAQDKQPVS
jgi:hypothetical protein